MPLDEHGHHDLDALADAASDAKVVVLCRPHNPTGTLESAADVERFLRRVPSDTIVLLDEAYIEFVAPEHRLDAPALVQRFPNVVVLRTFSKAYGLAGLRIGYGFGAPELARTVVDDAVAVRDRHHQRGRGGRQLRRGKPNCSSAFDSSPRSGDTCSGGCGRWASTAPMRTRTSCICPPPAEAGVSEFDAAGVRARHFADGGVRVTVGGRASTRAVLAALAQGNEGA